MFDTAKNFTFIISTNYQIYFNSTFVYQSQSMPKWGGVNPQFELSEARFEPWKNIRFTNPDLHLENS